MLTYTSNEAKTRFGEFIDRAQCEAMRAFYADRLLKTMDKTALAAEKAGLTPENLEQLLADER